MQKIFTRYLIGVVMTALFAMMFLSWGLQSYNARRRMTENAEIKLEQISQMIESNDGELKNLTESLNEDYLTRAKAFAYIIQQNSQVLESQEELQRIKELLNVDELHVINEKGILFAGTVPKYFGMDFRSSKQTEEFLKLLDGPDTYLVQDIQPNGAEQKIFQYVGVRRQDEPGIVQVGLAPRRLLEAQKKNELPYIFSRVPMDTGNCVFAIDAESGTIRAHSSESDLIGMDKRLMGLKNRDIERLSDGGFVKYGGRQTFYVLKKHGGLVLGMGMSDSTVYAGRAEQMALTFTYFLALSLIMIFVINRLLKRQIVSGIHKIVGSLHEITNGDLSTVVNEDSNPEFQQLSAGINQMVESILDASVRVAGIIDMLDVPIGVFEYKNGADRIMATDRLRKVLLWSEEEASEYYRDKGLFVRKLEELKQQADCREDESYRICASPERWVNIQTISDQSGTFGAVADVTEEVVERRKILYERDHDALTGLCNSNKFREETARLLAQGEEIGAAAMLMADLDNFKGVNDRYGHDWGDVYLKITADFLASFDRERSIAGRRSGDEFFVFLHHYGSEDEILGEVEAFYKRLQREEIPFPDGSRRKLQISVGLAWHSGELATYDALTKAADEALYISKNSGKGILTLYTPGAMGDES